MPLRESSFPRSSARLFISNKMPPFEAASLTCPAQGMTSCTELMQMILPRAFECGNARLRKELFDPLAGAEKLPGAGQTSITACHCSSVIWYSFIALQAGIGDQEYAGRPTRRRGCENMVCTSLLFGHVGLQDDRMAAAFGICPASFFSAFSAVEIVEFRLRAGPARDGAAREGGARPRDPGRSRRRGGRSRTPRRPCSSSGSATWRRTGPSARSSASSRRSRRTRSGSSTRKPCACSSGGSRYALPRVDGPGAEAYREAEEAVSRGLLRRAHGLYRKAMEAEPEQLDDPDLLRAARGVSRAVEGSDRRVPGSPRRPSRRTSSRRPRARRSAEALRAEGKHDGGDAVRSRVPRDGIPRRRRRPSATTSSPRRSPNRAKTSTRRSTTPAGRSPPRRTS